MPDSLRPQTNAASRFFDNYLTLLDRNKVPEKQRRWYVKHVEAFIKAQNGRKIKALPGVEVSAYLDMLGRQNRFTGWQFAQHIHAIRILYCDQLRRPPVTMSIGSTGWTPPENLMPENHAQRAINFNIRSNYYLSPLFFYYFLRDLPSARLS